MSFVIGILIDAPGWYYFVATAVVLAKFFLLFAIYDCRYITQKQLIEILEDAKNDTLKRCRKRQTDCYVDKDGLLRFKEEKSEKEL